MHTDRRRYSINILKTRVCDPSLSVNMCTVDGGTVKGYLGMVRKPISRYYIHVIFSRFRPFLDDFHSFLVK